MNLESPKVTVQKSAQELFDLLSDVKNFEKLMPENIAKFEVIGDTIIAGLDLRILKYDFIRNNGTGDTNN